MRRIGSDPFKVDAAEQMDLRIAEAAESAENEKG